MHLISHDPQHRLQYSSEISMLGVFRLCHPVHRQAIYVLYYEVEPHAHMGAYDHESTLRAVVVVWLPSQLPSSDCLASLKW